MVVASFDIGGTGIKAAFIDIDKQIRNRQEWSTPESLQILLEQMKDFMQQAESLDAISLSIPGAVDLDTGIIQGLSAIPYIHGVSWYDLLVEYSCPVYLENDANCVGLSELAIADSPSTFACVVVGTGIGGSLVVNGQLVRGARGFGGEFGYMLIDSGKQSLKNWSQLASTGSLVRAVAREYGESEKNWNGKKIFELASQGDLICEKAIDTMTRNIAIGCLNLFYFFEPQVIILGGSISQNPVFINSIQKQLDCIQKNHPEEFPILPKIRACHYKANANLVGSYMRTLQ